MNNDNIVQKLWNLCNILRGDGIIYHKYISELTYIIFLKVAEETRVEELLIKGCRWHDLVSYDGNNLLGFYQEMLTRLGVHAEDKLVKEIYAFPTTVFAHSENLKAVIDGIDKLDWHSISKDNIGQIYEGLLAKNSDEARSGAGQYFTPRAVVNCIVKVTKPQQGEVIQDPAIGTGGFLISTDHYLQSIDDQKPDIPNPPIYQGMEIERDTYRLCLMNIFLHRMKATIILGDALTDDVSGMDKADLILANPPFGSGVGSMRKGRKDIPFPTTNKQLAFLQHIYLGLKLGGRAAVVVPDNVLFEDKTGRQIRHDLMDKCNLHTILRLPTGIFYSHGVKTNVLFFTKGKTEKGNSKKVWIYDMRTNMPSFGIRTPLTEKHFHDFIKVFGEDPYGESLRMDQGEEGRFRCFNREWVKERNDSLDISWLKVDDQEDAANLPKPDVLAREALLELEGATSDLQDILVQLGFESEVAE